MAGKIAISKRKNYRKRKGAKKTLRRKRLANKDVLNRVFTSSFNLTPAQGVSVANYVYWTQPIWNYANNVDVTRNTEFLLHAMQYDRWRINAIKMSVYPKANVMELATAQNDGSYNVVGDGRCHTVVDRDGNGPNNISQMQRYASYKSHSILKPFSRTYSVKYPADSWLDCQALKIAETFDMRNQIGLAGGITLYAENFLEDNYEAFNEPWANIEVKYFCSFQGKTMANVTVSVDEDGQPSEVIMRPFVYNVNKPLSVPVNVKGTITPTITVNEITEVSDAN